MANDVKDDEQNVNLVNESYKEEQERKAREENENRDTFDKVTDFGRDIVDRGFNEVKSRAESEIKDKIFGSGEEAGKLLMQQKQQEQQQQRLEQQQQK